MTIAVITQIRNEAKRLEEWVSFHSKFHKIDHFLFYLDNPEDNSKEVLDRLKEEYPIEYEYTEVEGDYSGNNCMIATDRQKKSFTKGFNKLKHFYDWVAIFDVDEWIVPNDLENYDLRSTLAEVKENILYLPMYNFVPPFDYDKSITEQNFYRWSTEERIANGHEGCGKSIIRGKIYLENDITVDIHLGPDSPDYRNRVDFNSKNHVFRLHQWQNHFVHAGRPYEVYDDSIKQMLNKDKKTGKKIAFVATWYNLGYHRSLSEDNKFIIDCLYKTAKRYFLPGQDVEFIFITNDKAKIENVTTIKVDYNLNNISHAQLMKILSIKFLPNTYDYIFVSDTDQVFVGEVNEDILNEEFAILGHWNQKINGVHGVTARAITLDIEEKYKEEEQWTLGCFFGGKSKNVLDLLKLAEEEHAKHFISDNDFYTVYPEETLLLKYVFEQKIPFKRLRVDVFPGVEKKDTFFSDFNPGTHDLLISNPEDVTKILHNTKQYIKILKDKFGYTTENVETLTNEPLQPVGKVLIAQFYTDNVSHGKFSEAINRKYCEERGYDYYCEKDTAKIRAALKDKAPTWYKPTLVQEVLETYNPEYVLFLDIDAIVSDFNQKVEDFIDSRCDLIFTEDVGIHSAMNAGVFILKNTEWSKKFLQDWIDSAETLKGGDGRDLPINLENLERVGYYKNALWHDQTCLTYLYETRQDTKSKIKIISNASLNSNYYSKNSFIFHAYAYGGVSNRTLDIIHDEVFNIERKSTERLLDTVGNYNTDKNYEHDFFNLIYDEVLSPLKHEVKTFIEAGCLNGQSLLLWRDFFPNAKVYGLDIDINNVTSMLSSYNLDRLELRTVDCSSEEALTAFSSEFTGVDVILDDASHKMKDQQITLAKFFRILKPGGIFILEDLHTSLEAAMPEKAIFGWGDPNKTITLNMLEEFNRSGKITSDYISEEDRAYLEQNIESVNVYRSRPDWSITSIIRKKQKPVSPKVAIVYHCYLVNNWKEIVTDQLARVKESGLYDATDLFFATVDCNEDQQNEFRDLLKDYSKIQIEFTQTRHYEYPGIKKVKELGTEYDDLKIFYFHAKGVSNRYKLRYEPEVAEEKVKNIKAWRECLEYFLIDKWRESVEKLDSFDSVGVTCNLNWIWGNFWWTQSKHVKRTIDVNLQGRWFYEDWLNHAVEGYTIFEWYKFLYNPYVTFIDSDFYKRPDLSSLKIVLQKASYGFPDFEIDEGFHGYPISERVDVTETFREYLETRDNNNLQVSVNSEALKANPILEYPKKFLFLEFSLEGYPEKTYNIAFQADTFLNFKLF
jgi:SAM-dependent methyltransferase